MSLDELEEMATSRVAIGELAPEFDATIVKHEVKPDTRGRKCLYLTLKFKDKSSVTMKFTGMHIADLVAFMKANGVKDLEDLYGTPLHWKLREYRIGNKRHIPTTILQEKKK
jgi:hypothetical protein